MIALNKLCKFLKWVYTQAWLLVISISLFMTLLQSIIFIVDGNTGVGVPMLVTSCIAILGVEMGMGKLFKYLN